MRQKNKKIKKISYMFYINLVSYIVNKQLTKITVTRYMTGTRNQKVNKIMCLEF